MLYQIIRAAFHHDGLLLHPDRVSAVPGVDARQLRALGCNDPSTGAAAAPTRRRWRSAPAWPRSTRTGWSTTPATYHRAREIASELDPVPIGILYHDPSVPRYEEIVRSQASHSTAAVRSLLDEEFDKFAVSSAGATGGELGD